MIREPLLNRSVRDSTILMTITGLYGATLIVANVTAGKLFDFCGVAISAGAFAYILCLGLSDILVEVYGPSVGYRLVRIAASLNVVVLLFEQLALRLPIAHGQEALEPHFQAVFGASTSVIVASLIGFPITDTFETFMWKRIKILTSGRLLWLRNACVKVPGQLLDATVFFNLAFFLLPLVFEGKPLIEGTSWWPVMKGAWIYGLWKGCLGMLDYPLIRVAIPWIRRNRIADILHLDQHVQEEARAGRW